MSDLAKQQFDKWLHEIVAESTDGQRIQRRDCMTADQECMVFEGWKASRECLVIELPDRFDEHYQDYYEDVDGGCFNEGRYINDVHAALTAAGVKYK